LSVTELRDQTARLARWEGDAGLAQAFASVWPEPPSSGTVTLVTRATDEQGTLSACGLALEVIEAAAERLGTGGAQVQVLVVPGDLDESAGHGEACDRLAAAGLEVVSSSDGREVAIDGTVVARAEIEAAILDAEHVAVLAPAMPHHVLRVAATRLELSSALTPEARRTLWRTAPRGADLLEALGELQTALSPGWVAAVIPGHPGTIIGGADSASVDAVAAYLLGFDTHDVATTGLDPATARRDVVSARERLPDGPDRFPGVDMGLCTQCGSCVELCPTGAIAEVEETGRGVVFDHNACLRCGICVSACPDFALTASTHIESARLVPPRALALVPAHLPARVAAVPARAALALGPGAIDPPVRRPSWLEGYTPPDRFEMARQRERHPEPVVARQSLDCDGHVRLIIPPNWGIRGNRTSLGAAYLAGMLEASGHPCHVVDLAHELRIHDPRLDAELAELGDPRPNGGVYGPEMPLLLQVMSPEAWSEPLPTFAAKIVESAERDAERVGDPDALHGLTIADSNVHYAFALAGALSRRGCRVVMGGPSMSHPPTADLALLGGVAHAVVVGEGELAIEALAKAHRDGTWEGLGSELVPGLSVVVDGLVTRKPNFRNRALDALPYPDWKGQVHPPDFIPILAARGCVTKCSFCSEQTISPKFAQRSVEDVLTEMDVLHARYGQSCFEFNDDLLNGNMKWLDAFCDALLARGAPYSWQGLCRPHRLDRDMLEKMRDAGCAQMTYGVQHFSWHMLKVMGRKEEPDPLMQVLDDTLDLGMETYIDVILGHPGETEEDVEITVETVRSLMERYPNLAINLNPFNYIYGSAVDIDPASFDVEVVGFTDALPPALAHLQALAGRFVIDTTQTPDARTVVDRVNRLAWTVFQARRPPKIPILDEELPFCNDNCLHCGVADIMKTANVVPFKRIESSLRELAPRSGGSVMFAVSELTIRPDFIRIIEASRAASMKIIALVTNGRMFSYPEFTRRTVEAGLTHALVSVYGPTPRIHQSITRTPKSFEQTIAGLQDLLRYPQVTVMTNSVITKKNAAYLPQMVELLAGLGVRNVNLSFVQIVGAADTYSRALIPRIRDVLTPLREAVDLGVELGLNMGIGGLPYCVLKGYEHHFGVDDLTTIANGDPDDNITARSPYTHAEACRKCAYNAVCLGMQDEYLKRFGEEELDPYHGRRLERRPESEIVRAMFPEMQYTERGAPSSLFGGGPSAAMATGALRPQSEEP
jgi:cyclic pyranopterin phosphate synthase